MTSLTTGIVLALLFVAIRGGNSACFALGKRELPTFALMAVSMFVLAVLSLLASWRFDTDVDWSKLANPLALQWTLTVGLMSFIYLYLFLRSLDHIPPWLTQSFIGLEPFFSVVGMFLIAWLVTDADVASSLLSKMPANWWLFAGGLVLVVVGVTLMALSQGERK